MSVQAMAWALKQRIVTDPAGRHVLLCLANYAGQDGVGAFPSVETLCGDTGLAERTIRAKLAALEKSGAIVRGNQAIAAAHIGRKDRRPTVYDLPVERGAPAAPRSVTGCISRQNGVHLTAERGAPAAPNPRALSIIDPTAVDKSTRQSQQPRRPAGGTREAEGKALAAILAELGVPA